MNVSHYVHASLLLLCVACHGTSVSSSPSSTVNQTPGVAGAASPAVAPSESSGPAAAPAPPATRDALEMPVLEAGFQRFVAPPIEVAAGAANDWMQWVGGPTDQDYDVSQMKGAQTRIGHHAILYTTTDANPPGTTRIWTERDQLTTQTVGGVGAEGAIPIPPGVVLRIKKGTYLVFDVHYFNATDESRVGQTYMDVKLTPADPKSVLASRVANSSLMVALPPHQEAVLDLTCTLTQEMRLLRFTNHMHEYGVSVFTEFLDPSGVAHMIQRDDAWNEHWSLSPNYTFHPVEAPLIVPAGSRLHTRCAWKNTTDAPIKFPNEMCAFSGLILGGSDITCLDGKTPMAPPPADAMVAGSGAAGSPAPADAGAPAAGACASASDRMVLSSDDFNRQFKNCGAMCFGAADSCATECLLGATALSQPCAACNGTQISCAMMHCVLDCSSDVASAGCKGCIETNCGAAYRQCAGS